MEKADFINLLTRHYHRIYSFILCMVPNENDSEDIMQETAALMWEKFDEFESGTNFVAWGTAIAKYKILSYHRDRSRSKIHLTSDVMNLLETERSSVEATEPDRKIKALRQCLKRLPLQKRELLKLKFSENLTAKMLSEKVGSSVYTIYRLFSKIYEHLLECITRSLEQGDFL